MENKKNLYSSVFFFVLGIAYFSGTFGIKQITRTTVDASFIPKLLAVALIILSLSLMIVSFLKLNKEKDKQNIKIRDELKAHISKKTILTFFLLVFYVLLLAKIGFVVTTIIYLIAQILVLEEVVKKNTFIRAFVISLTSTFAVYFIFEKILLVLLPHGLLF